MKCSVLARVVAFSVVLCLVACAREDQSSPIEQEPEVEVEAPTPEFAGGPVADRDSSDHDVIAPDLEIIEETKTIADPPPPQETAFESNAWNSAVGLGGGRVGGRGGVGRPPSAETYSEFASHGFVNTLDAPLSTFAADVDTASYANARRHLFAGSRPPRDAVRVEEFVNYFRYAAPAAAADHPLAVHTVVGPAPWNPKHWLLRVQLHAAAYEDNEQPPRNIVCLIDVSGSMQDSNKLPLLQRAMGLLVDQLRPIDRLAIVTYAGDARIALSSTAGDQRATIRRAIDALVAGGSTHGSAGIRQAYEVAHQHHESGVASRVLLATDGDFNVGVTTLDELTALIEREREGGVFLSVLGFGSGNLKDATMERLANRGNGMYSYIDNIAEARKVLVNESGGTFVTVAKDVKLQLEFNPRYVRGYRQIGYENRKLAARDFNDDSKDAGEVGSGHQVTALYELVPVDAPWPDDVDPLRYQPQATAPTTDGVPAASTNEIVTVKLRYQPPTGGASQLVERHIESTALQDTLDPETRFAAAAAAFGQLLRSSPHLGKYSFGDVLELARTARGDDLRGERSEFLRLVQMAADL